MPDPTNLPQLIARNILIQQASTAKSAVQADLDALNAQMRTLHDQIAAKEIELQDADRKLQIAGTIQDASLPVDQYGAYSLIDQAQRAERFAAKSAGFDYLAANPSATQADVVAAMNATVTSGTPLNNYDALINAYITNAHTQGLIPDATWGSFGAFLLSIGKDKAMGL